jgi:phosphatidylserine decarboxylase
MIRIGSQVDIVLPLREGVAARVKPGDRVRAGETVLAEYAG